MKTAKTTQGHLAVIKARNEAYEASTLVFIYNIYQPKDCQTHFKYLHNNILLEFFAAFSFRFLG